MLTILVNTVPLQVIAIALWIVVFIVALGIELSTTQLVSVWFSGGALVALVLAIFNIPLLWQIVAWAIASGILLVISKLVFKKKFDVRTTKTNTDSLIGEDILIVSKVTKEQKGEGKIRDIVWSVITYDELPIEEGDFAKVKRIEGNKLIVTRKEK